MIVAVSGSCEPGAILLVGCSCSYYPGTVRSSLSLSQLLVLGRTTFIGPQRCRSDGSSTWRKFAPISHPTREHDLILSRTRWTRAPPKPAQTLTFWISTDTAIH